MTHTACFRLVYKNSFARLLLALLLLALSGQVAFAASTWNPTMLVNTESFEIIDSGDGLTNIELRFGDTGNRRLFYDVGNGRFQFTQAVLVGGNLTATGSVSVKRNISGATLRVDGNSDIWGNLGASGSLKVGTTSTFNGVATHNANVKVRGNLSGSTLRVDGNADVWGSLSATGALKTKSNITINSDSDTNDATLTFGNQTADQTLKYSHANQRFEFSKDVKVTGNVRASGNLSGATLTVDGTLNWHGQSYTGPTSQGANTFLKTDGAGNLTWSSVTVGNGSGNIMAIRPEYPNAIYFGSGSSNVGTLNYNTDTTNNQNYYHWVTTKGTLQDYWVSVQIQIPKNFSHFETASGMTLRIRTSTTSASDNHITLRMKDTAGNNVALTTNASLASTSANAWRTVTIGGVSTGTYTPGSDIIVYVKMAATSTGFVDLGSINFNWASTTP